MMELIELVGFLLILTVRLIGLGITVYAVAIIAMLVLMLLPYVLFLFIAYIFLKGCL
jgi:hypothetical protein